MKILIVENVLDMRNSMFGALSEAVDCDLAADGMGAVEALMKALDKKSYYDLICLDIIMPEKTLKTIQNLETEWEVPIDKRAKIIMTTTQKDAAASYACFKGGCESYVVKMLDSENFRELLAKLESGTVIG